MRHTPSETPYEPVIWTEFQPVGGGCHRTGPFLHIFAAFTMLAQMSSCEDVQICKCPHLKCIFCWGGSFREKCCALPKPSKLTLQVTLLNSGRIITIYSYLFIFVKGPLLNLTIHCEPVFRQYPTDIHFNYAPQDIWQRCILTKIASSTFNWLARNACLFFCSGFPPTFQRMLVFEY